MPRYQLNGITLNTEITGSGPAVLLLHGFTGAIAAWQTVRKPLEDIATVISADIIGHGGSSAPENPDRYRIECAIDDLRSLLDKLDLGQVSIVGYSMGGRVAIHFALRYPERVDRLVLESAGPGISDPNARQVRRQNDEKLAEIIERKGIEEFINYWENIPLFDSQRRLPSTVRARQRAVRCSHNPHGLANSLRGMGAGAMEPTENRLHELSMPVCYLAGALDEKYRTIGRQVTEQVPNAEYHEVVDAGHTIHLEQPERWMDIVSQFISRN